jgi:hypothetical protein
MTPEEFIEKCYVDMSHAAYLCAEISPHPFPVGSIMFLDAAHDEMTTGPIVVKATKLEMGQGWEITLSSNDERERMTPKGAAY